MFSAVLLCACDSSGGQGTAGPKPTWTGSRARDVACGTAVAVSSAPHRFVYRDHEFLLCSDACLTQFKMYAKGHKTGLPGETCTCGKAKTNCACGHCSGKAERCACADPKN